MLQDSYMMPLLSRIYCSYSCFFTGLDLLVSPDLVHSNSITSPLPSYFGPLDRVLVSSHTTNQRLARSGAFCTAVEIVNGIHLYHRCAEWLYMSVAGRVGSNRFCFATRLLVHEKTNTSSLWDHGVRWRLRGYRGCFDR